MTAASPSRASEVSPAPSAPTASIPAPAEPQLRKTIVVRADPRTGKLVRGVVVTPVRLPDAKATEAKAAPEKATVVKAASARETAAKSKSPAIQEMVERSARAHQVDPLLVHAVIQVESAYNPLAISSKGAEGLMQLMPGTARQLGVSNSFDPSQNIEAGVKYLKYLQDLFKDDRLALAAYNAGPGAVDKYKWIPPYPETQNYVYQVGKRYGEARQSAAAAEQAKKVAVEKAEKVEERQPKLDSFVDQNGRLHLRTTQ